MWRSLAKPLQTVHNRWKMRRRLSPIQIVALYYVIATCVAMILLGLPVSRHPGVELSFIDLLFTSVSAISVTGLTVVNTADTFSPVGILFMALVMQFGGIGVMALGAFIWLLFGRRIGMRDRQMIMLDQNRTGMSGLVALMRNLLILVFSIELVGSLILGLYFYNYYIPELPRALYYGFFTSVSAFTNAGFDIFGDSLSRFSGDYFVQAVNMLLIVLGAIGFPVLMEVKEYLTRGNQPYRFSLFTKITVSTFFILLFVGFTGILLIENQRFFAGMEWHQKFFHALFTSTTSRSAGLSTFDAGQLSEPSHLLLSFMMFIGSSPSSVGGGIRTTTFAVLVLMLYYYARGYSEIKVFKREIHPDDVQKAVAVFLGAVFLVTSSIFLLSLTNPHDLTALVFEASSAFGTTGLTLGITSELDPIGKLIITVLMFMGRMGIFWMLLLFRPTRKVDYHFAKERIIVG